MPIGVSGIYDCIIATQVLNFIDDIPAAIAGLRMLLKDGGVCIATVSGISQISPFDDSRWGDYWRFTDTSAKRSFKQYFHNDIQVSTYGNLISATALLHGIHCENLTASEIDFQDPRYPVTIGIIAQRRDQV